MSTYFCYRTLVTLGRPHLVARVRVDPVRVVGSTGTEPAWNDKPEDSTIQRRHAGLHPMPSSPQLQENFDGTQPTASSVSPSREWTSDLGEQPLARRALP